MSHVPPSTPRRRRPWALLAPLALGLPLGGCQLVVMNPTGDVALQQRDLILISTALMLVIIVPVMIATVLFAWRYRAGNRAATYDPHFDHSTPLELMIWAAPLLIVICLGAITWSSTHLLDPWRPLGRIAPGRPIPAGTKPLDVEVVAMDWKWLFIYPQLGIATVNELALPVDVPVRFTITSSTQMNTFFAPTLAGMIYAMPGMQTTLNAVLNKPGDTWGLSGNYSGAGFSDMRFALRGMDRAGFDRWVAGVRQARGTLVPASYVALDRPSEKVPAMHFASVTPGLFARVVNRCVEPGRPCMADVMRHDRGAQGKGDMPAMNQGGGMADKPTPALLKDATDKGSGPNVTKPRGPAAGNKAPGAQKNRDMSLLTPLTLPGTSAGVRA